MNKINIKMCTVKSFIINTAIFHKKKKTDLSILISCDFNCKVIRVHNNCIAVTYLCIKPTLKPPLGELS